MAHLSVVDTTPDAWTRSPDCTRARALPDQQSPGRSTSASKRSRGNGSVAMRFTRAPPGFVS
jgi:hypothetical protein